MNRYMYAIWDSTGQDWFAAMTNRRLGRTFYDEANARTYFEGLLARVHGGRELALMELDIMGSRPDVVIAEGCSLFTAEQRERISSVTVALPAH